MTNKSAKPEIVGAFLPLHEQGNFFIIEMHGTEKRFVTGPSDILFASLHMRTFQPGYFRGRGGERVTALPSGGRSYDS